MENVPPRRSPARPARRMLVAIIAPVAILCGGAAYVRGLQDGGPGDLARFPPRVQRAAVQRLRQPIGENTARLLLRLHPDPRFGDGSVIPMKFEGEEIPLRDDGQLGDDRRGDGLFTALVRVSPEQLEGLNRTIAENIQKEPAVPVFSGRELIGRRKVSFLDINAFREFRPIPFEPIRFFLPLNPAKTLMVTHPSVVEDPTRTFNICAMTGNPNGKWTFGFLMTQMANTPVTGVSPSTFARRWLNRWLVPQTVNGDTAAARAAITNRVIRPWEIMSGVGPGGPLNMTKAPFKLLAIVNRVDLRTNGVYGGGDAGEARFVFCLMDKRPGFPCNPLPFLVIFEYGVPRSGCHEVRDWGQKWADLNALVLGSPAYNAALEDITDEFSLANAGGPGKPNRSALNQLRTNENTLNPVWELREFVINPTTHLLTQDTVKNSPADIWNNTVRMRNYMNGGPRPVPEDFPLAGNDFLGVKNRYFAFTFLNAPPALNPVKRRQVSLDACSGCHARETNTFFTHVGQAPFGAPAPLSGFLTGINVPDPAGVLPPAHYDDLARRAADLNSLIHTLCHPIFPPLDFPIMEIFFEPLTTFH